MDVHAVNDRLLSVIVGLAIIATLVWVGNSRLWPAAANMCLAAALAGICAVRSLAIEKRIHNLVGGLSELFVADTSE